MIVLLRPVCGQAASHLLSSIRLSFQAVGLHHAQTYLVFLQETPITWIHLSALSQVLPIMPHLPFSFWPTIPGDIYKIEFPQLNRATLAGITVAIAGNVLISLALNCQKLAHIRLEDEREAKRAEADKHNASNYNIHHDVFSDTEEDRNCDNFPTPVELRSSLHRNQGIENSPRPDSIESVIPGIALLETQPLLPSLSSSSSISTYGSNASDVSTIGRGTGQWKRNLLPTFWHRRSAENMGGTDHVGATHAMLPVDVVPVPRTPKKRGHSSNSGNRSHAGSEGDYLKSKLW